jgi:hypothetical protein
MTVFSYRKLQFVISPAEIAQAHRRALRVMSDRAGVGG